MAVAPVAPVRGAPFDDAGACAVAPDDGRPAASTPPTCRRRHDPPRQIPGEHQAAHLRTWQRRPPRRRRWRRRSARPSDGRARSGRSACRRTGTSGARACAGPRRPAAGVPGKAAAARTTPPRVTRRTATWWPGRRHLPRRSSDLGMCCRPRASRTAIPGGRPDRVRTPAWRRRPPRWSDHGTCRRAQVSGSGDRRRSPERSAEPGPTEALSAPGGVPGADPAPGGQVRRGGRLGHPCGVRGGGRARRAERGVPGRAARTVPAPRRRCGTCQVQEGCVDERRPQVDDGARWHRRRTGRCGARRSGRRGAGRDRSGSGVRVSGRSRHPGPRPAGRSSRATRHPGRATAGRRPGHRGPGRELPPPRALRSGARAWRRDGRRTWRPRGRVGAAGGRTVRGGRRDWSGASQRREPGHLARRTTLVRAPRRSPVVRVVRRRGWPACASRACRTSSPSSRRRGRPRRRGPGSSSGPGAWSCRRAGSWPGRGRAPACAAGPGATGASATAADRTADTSDHQRGGCTSAGPEPIDTEAAGPTSDRRTATDRPHPAENRADEDASDPIGDGRARPSTGPGRRSRTPMARPSRVRGSPAVAPGADDPVGPGADGDPAAAAAVTASSPGSRCAPPRGSP